MQPTKIRHEWFQSNDNVTLTLFAKGVPKDKAVVDIQDNSVSARRFTPALVTTNSETQLSISFPLPTGSDYDFSLEPLFAPVNTSASTYAIMSTKVEIILKKGTPGQKWKALEGDANSATTAPIPTTTATDSAVKQAAFNSKAENTIATSSGPAYPTSSRTGAKNWDKLAEDLTRPKPKTKKSSTNTTDKKDPEKDHEHTESCNHDHDHDHEDNDDDGADEYEDEADPMQGFFKKIYASADDDTKRAMMKSYQESNGTALSTNWSEVGKAPVETQPPDGMVARKWGQ